MAFYLDIIYSLQAAFISNRIRYEYGGSVIKPIHIDPSQMFYFEGKIEFHWLRALSNCLTALAGAPTQIVLVGMSLLTTEFAPIIAPFPIVTPAKTQTFSPIQTLLPMLTGEPCNSRSSGGIVGED